MKNLKKDKLLSAFSKMDIDSIGFLLDDSKTYSDAKKEIIVEKLRELFDTFKAGNDSSLIPYRGECTGCSSKGCKGYSFVGNNSKKHTDLIFEETDTEVNDFYHCPEFKIENAEVETSGSVFLSIAGDEKAEFVPTVKYLNAVQQCETAVEEIIKEWSNFLTKETYQPWLTKYKELYDLIHDPFDPYSKFEKFESIYYELSYISDYLKYEQEAERALEDFYLIDKENEETLINWLTNYESFWNEVAGFYYKEFDEQNIENGYLNISEQYDLKITAKDYCHVILFNKKFNEYYWPILEKYNTITEREWNDAPPESELSKKSHSLKFHLERRATLSEK